MACYYIVISSTHLRDGQLRSIKGVFRGPIRNGVQRNAPAGGADSECESHFYCGLCDKQYQRHQEFDNHTNSYDHAHKQRLKELKQREFARSLGGRSRYRWRTLKQREDRKEERTARQLHQQEERKEGACAPPGCGPMFRSTTVAVEADQGTSSFQNPANTQQTGPTALTLDWVRDWSSGGDRATSRSQLQGESSLCPVSNNGHIQTTQHTHKDNNYSSNNNNNINSSSDPTHSWSMDLQNQNQTCQRVCFSFPKKSCLRLDASAAAFTESCWRKGWLDRQEEEPKNRKRRGLTRSGEVNMPSDNHMSSQTNAPACSLNEEGQGSQESQGQMITPVTTVVPVIGHSEKQAPHTDTLSCHSDHCESSPKVLTMREQEEQTGSYITETEEVAGQQGASGSLSEGEFQSSSSLSHTKKPSSSDLSRPREPFCPVLSRDGTTVLQWPTEMVSYTKSGPSLSYSCNPLCYDFRACRTGQGNSVREADQRTTKCNTEESSSGRDMEQGTAHCNTEQDSSGREVEQGTIRCTREQDSGGREAEQGTAQQNTEQSSSGREVEQGRARCTTKQNSGGKEVKNKSCCYGKTVLEPSEAVLDLSRCHGNSVPAAGDSNSADLLGLHHKEERRSGRRRRRRRRRRRAGRKREKRRGEVCRPEGVTQPFSDPAVKGSNRWQQPDRLIRGSSQQQQQSQAAGEQPSHSCHTETAGSPTISLVPVQGVTAGPGRESAGGQTHTEPRGHCDPEIRLAPCGEEEEAIPRETVPGIIQTACAEWAGKQTENRDQEPRVSPSRPPLEPVMSQEVSEGRKRKWEISDSWAQQWKRRRRGRGLLSGANHISPPEDIDLETANEPNAEEGDDLCSPPTPDYEVNSDDCLGIINTPDHYQGIIINNCDQKINNSLVERKDKVVQSEHPTLSQRAGDEKVMERGKGKEREKWSERETSGNRPSEKETKEQRNKEEEMEASKERVKEREVKIERQRRLNKEREMEKIECIHGNLHVHSSLFYEQLFPPSPLLLPQSLSSSISLHHTIYHHNHLPLLPPHSHLFPPSSFISSLSPHFSPPPPPPPPPPSFYPSAPLSLLTPSGLFPVATTFHPMAGHPPSLFPPPPPPPSRSLSLQVIF